MALKRNPETESEVVQENSISGQKAKQLFSKETRTTKKENKVLTTFSIEPSFKRELEELFASMGLGWAAGIRFSLKEFSKKHAQE
jgi:arsenate reductase-like glutaredoxin family protein